MAVICLFVFACTRMMNVTTNGAESWVKVAQEMQWRCKKRQGAEAAFPCGTGAGLGNLQTLSSSTTGTLLNPQQGPAQDPSAQDSQSGGALSCTQADVLPDKPNGWSRAQPLPTGRDGREVIINWVHCAHQSSAQ